MNNSWNGFLKRQPNDASNWVDQRLSYNWKTILINGFENLENGGYGFMIHLGKESGSILHIVWHIKPVWRLISTPTLPDVGKAPRWIHKSALSATMSLMVASICDKSPLLLDHCQHLFSSNKQLSLKISIYDHRMPLEWAVSLLSITVIRVDLVRLEYY